MDLCQGARYTGRSLPVAVRHRPLIAKALDAQGRSREMIGCDCQWDNLTVWQRCEPPVVYLDHWALMTFSDDVALGNRLVAALHEKQGTYALSWLNWGEFGHVTDPSHAIRADAFLERIRPRLFFLEPNPFVVRDRENELLQGRAPRPPHGDQDLLRVFFVLDKESLDPLSAKRFFCMATGQDVSRRRTELAQEIMGRVNCIHDQYGTDEAYRKAVNRQTNGPQIQCGTRYIFRELLALITKDGRHPFTEHDAIDMLHAVVPAAYCDCLLLDKHWEALLNRARDRLRRNGMEFPVASVFSARGDGIERFLGHLESSN